MPQNKKTKKAWVDIKRRLSEFPTSFHSGKTIEMLDLCVSHEELQMLIPYISLGRLCLSRNTTNLYHYTSDCPCMYFHKDQYTVSTYDNLHKWYFDKPEEAIEFVKQNSPFVD